MQSLFAVPVFPVFVNSLLFADQIAFKNGDRLTGAIIRSDAKVLVIRTAVAGEVTAAWQEIQGLTSDQPLYVGLVDGATLAGRVTTREGRLEIATKTGTVEAPKENVAALPSQAEQRVFEKSQRPDFLHRWEGGLDAGFDLTRLQDLNLRSVFGGGIGYDGIPGLDATKYCLFRCRKAAQSHSIACLLLADPKWRQKSNG